MKELSVEEKAKRYDEALERAEKALEVLGTDKCEGARQIFSLFPKLKEGEDGENKRISKEITQFLKQNNGWNREWLSWLEKQGEQKQDPCEHCKDKCLNCHNFPCVEKRAFELGKYVSENSNENTAIAQTTIVQQKDFVSIEPKFHEGDWVVGANNVLKIISLNDELNCYIAVTSNNEEVKIPYHFDDGQGHMCSYHLWTIQDAKDGDVLVESKGDVILMFRGIGNTELDDAIDYHCYYDCYRDSFIVQEDESYWGNTKNNQLKPATKEQRDLLFQKMTEAGYEWDANKLELKKIDMQELVKQNSAWTEEDEWKFSDILALLRGGENCHYNTPDLFDWLKSLKDRFAWMPNDEQIKVCKEVYADLLSAKGFDVGAVNSELNRLEEQLKKLREE